MYIKEVGDCISTYFDSSFFDLPHLKAEFGLV
jgi:hypothetical protein